MTGEGPVFPADPASRAKIRKRLAESRDRLFSRVAGAGISVCPIVPGHTGSSRQITDILRDRLVLK